LSNAVRVPISLSAAEIGGRAVRHPPHRDDGWVGERSIRRCTWYADVPDGTGLHHALTDPSSHAAQPAMNSLYADSRSGGSAVVLHWRCVSPIGARMPRKS
jgi:hypothetical protein